MGTQLHPHGFGDLITPVSPEEFSTNYFGRTFMHVPGRSGRWHDLVTLSEVDSSLRRMRSRGRIKMYRDGVALDASRYLEDKEREFGHLTKPFAIENELRNGSSLLIRCTDELYDGVYGLAQSLRHVFRAPVEAAMFLSLGALRALNLHWDPSDTFVVQVRGRKSWQVYEPTVTVPRDVYRATDPKPVGPPTWEGVLSDGDVLYLPRGWWHAPTPLDGLSLHVTFTVWNPTGLDVLRWLSEIAPEITLLRTRLPCWSSQEVQERYTAELKTALCTAFGSNAVEGYIRWTDSKRAGCRAIQIADSNEREVLTHSSANGEQPADVRVRLSDRHRLHIVSKEQGDIEFEALAIKWRCNEAFRPALALLSDTEDVSMATLGKLVEPALVSSLRAFLFALAMRGVLTRPSSSAGCQAQTVTSTLSDH